MTNNQELPRNELAELYTFDPDVFRADKDVPQEVCDFVLTLALIFNDFKDTVWIRFLIKNAKENEKAYTAVWGEFNGIDLYFARLGIGILRELMELIASQQKKGMHSGYFQKVLDSISKDAQKAWNSLNVVSLGGKATNDTLKILVRLRSKIGFHYEPSEIGKGYKNHFYDVNGQKTQRAYISSGHTLEATRFYFADGAAESYGKSFLSANELEHFKKQQEGLLSFLNLALKRIIEAFIQKRAPYRKATPGTLEKD